MRVPAASARRRLERSRRGHRAYQYDPQGRRTTADCGGRLTRYRYDGLGQMSGVELPDGTSIDYLYDAQGQRLGRRRNGLLERGWLYQSPLNIAAELDGDNQLKAVFLQGQSPNVADGMVKGGHTYRLLTDHLGSVGYVVDIDTGDIVQALEYDEWCKVLKDTNPGFQPFGYAGGLYDADTGLVRFGARDYDPREGRWVTKDPIGLAGGYNVYSYAYGNPIYYVDSDGRFVWVAGGALAGGVFGAVAGAAQAIAGGEGLGGVAWAAATGAAGGALTGALAMANPWAAAAASAAAAGVGDAINQAATKECMNWGQSAKAAAAGFAGGLLGTKIGGSVFGSLASPSVSGSAFAAAQFAQAAGAAASTAGSAAAGAALQ